MYKALLAVIVAAGCAAMLVGLVPPPSPATAAVQSAERGVSDAVKPVPARSVDMRNSGCAQAWPYYEQSCLRDSRRLDGSAGAVRVIATGKPASERVRQARREQ